MNPSATNHDGFAKTCSWRLLLSYALLGGAIAGIGWSVEPPQLSRWQEYESIELGASRQEAIAIVESSETSQSGCGAIHSENTETVCRFEDPWRSYVVKFNPETSRVVFKRFNFKRVPGFRVFFNAR